MEPYKFAQLQGADQLPYRYPNVWAVEQTTGPERLVMAPAAHHIDLLIQLIRQLPEPFAILYVLVVPRGGSGSLSKRPAMHALSIGSLSAKVSKLL